MTIFALNLSISCMLLDSSFKENKEFMGKEIKYFFSGFFWFLQNSLLKLWGCVKPYSIPESSGSV